MSTPSPPAEAPTKLNKAELVSDILAFASIVTAFLFLSHTWQYNYLDAIFGPTRSPTSDIALFYLLYSLLIVILKIVAAVTKWRKGESDSAKDLENVIGRSLFAVTLIIAIHIITLQAGEQELNAVCQITAWLFVAELNLIFCGLLSKVAFFQSLALFGWTIEVILVLGQLARLLHFDFFEVL